MTTLTHSCPQCGGPVTLSETDRLFTCDYCRVSHTITTRGPAHFFIPPRIRDKGELVYLPYRRFRGLGFTLSREGVAHRIMDTSFLAAELPGAPISLGLRTQALAMRFVEPQTPGTFLAPKISFRHGLRNQAPPSPPGPAANAFIGDLESVIFSPLVKADNGLLDGVTGAKLLSTPPDLPASDAPPDPGYTFVPSLCPACGWDLSGPRDSMVLQCEHCETHWSTFTGKVGQLDAAVQFAPDHDSTLLPFWEMTISFVRKAADLPSHIRPPFPAAPSGYRVPAFKLHPELFLRLARQFSGMRLPAPARSFAADIHHLPVTLPLGEALQSLTLLPCKGIRQTRDVLEVLKFGSLRLHHSRVLYIPFSKSGPDLLQQESGLAVQARAVRWGVKL